MKPELGAQGPVVLRFLIAGIIATASNLIAFQILVNMFGMWYVMAAPITFLIGFFVSFVIQKYWTFRDGDKKVVRQASLYFVILLCNLCLNTGIVYVLIEYGHVWNVLAQAIASLVIAAESFFVYRFFVFIEPAIV